LLLTISLGLCACTGVTRGNSRDSADGGAQASQAPDGGQPSQDAAKGSPEPRGVAGAHIWFSTSVSLKLREEWAYIGWGGTQGSSGSSCSSFERGALSEYQLHDLDAITLVPITDACSSDGFSLQELTVVDADGTSASYRDTGCPSLRIKGAQAMLPYALGGTFTSSSTTCDDSGAPN
jgi:hypothetical protein